MNKKWAKELPSTELRCDSISSSSTITSLAIHSVEDASEDVASRSRSPAVNSSKALRVAGGSWWLAEELLPHVLSFIVEVGANLRLLREVCKCTQLCCFYTICSSGRAFNAATQLPQCYQGSHVHLSSGVCKAVDPEARWMKVLELPLELVRSCGFIAHR